MQSTKQINEQLQAEIAEVKIMLLQLQAEKEQPKTGFWAKVKNHFAKLANNAVNDPQLTVAGAIAAGAIVYQSYPTIDAVQVVQALGITYTGAMATSYRPKKVNESTHNELEEIG
jgi:glutaredoxin-related protein